MRTIALCNQKGGTGKSTSAHAIITGALDRGHKVLAVDADAQANLSYAMGADANKAGVFDIMTGRATATAAIQHTPRGDIIPGSLQLATIDSITAGNRGKGLLLKGALAEVKGYDVVVIDCAPGLGVLMMNSLAAATEVLIPMQADVLSLQGLYMIAHTIENTRTEGLTVRGCFLTRYNGRSVLSRDMATAIAAKCKALGLPYIDTPIREAVAVREAAVMRQSILDYAPKSKPAQDYLALLDAIKL